MSLKNYKESLGLIGTDSLSFMADRMFAVMDKDHDGQVSCFFYDCSYKNCFINSQITIEEYLCYIDVMLYGTEEEKRK